VAGGVSDKGKLKRNWGCISASMFALVVVLFFVWPYRLETVSAVVGANLTGCTIDASQVSDWHERTLLPLVHASDQADPLQVFLFVDACPGQPAGKPFAVELRAPNGKLLAAGIACGAAGRSEYPCRIEAPPIARAGDHHFTVRIIRSHVGIAVDVPIEVKTAYEWRSVVWEGMMSV
jgi:hypothetical protein